MDREGAKASLEPLLESRLKVDDIQLKKQKVIIESREIFVEARKQLWLAGPLVTVSVSLLNLLCSWAISVNFLSQALQWLLLLPLSPVSAYLIGRNGECLGHLLRAVIWSKAASFLQTQSLVFPMLFSSGVTTLLHILICWIMVFKSGLGNKGAAVANAISYWLNVFILMLYINFSPSCSKTWTGFSREAFHNIPSFLRLAIPSAVMHGLVIVLEMWSFEMMVLLSGLLPNPKLETSVLSICLNTSTTVWTIPFGLSGAVSTRVSNELGAGHPKAARLGVYFVFAMAMVEGIFVGAIMILIRNIWGYAIVMKKKWSHM
ncbi:Protein DETOXIFICATION 16 [Stylosanthes scabra]|uniref:Protein DETOXIFICATION 16 n=1 Tax=Stylosanthes scabra TaxID=79078 RepID=A0ABU6XBV4_9FABA|nr:Protein DETOXIFICATION 16 [Stylosanthes scabra]